MKRIGCALAAALATIACGCIVSSTSLTRLDTNALFAGEVHNYGGTDLLTHDLEVQFLDADGAVLESETVVPCLNSLQRGASDFFEAQYNDPSATTQSARAHVALDSTLRAGNVAPAHLTLSSVSAAQRGGRVTVTGTATNGTAVTIATPKVCAIAKSLDNKLLRVVAVAIAPPNPASTGDGVGSIDLGPGAHAAFKISFALPNGVASAARLDVYADGFQDGVPVSPAAVTGLSVTVLRSP